MLKTISLLLPLVTIAGLLTVQRVRKFPPDLLGFRWPSSVSYAGWLAVWLVWMAISEWVGVRLGVVAPKAWHYSIGMTILRVAMIGVAGPIAEELAYRGAMLYALRVRLGLSAALGIVVTSIVWAASHFDYNLPTLGMIFIDGLILGAARVQSKSTATSGTMHVMGNLLSIYQSLRGTGGA